MVSCAENALENIDAKNDSVAFSFICAGHVYGPMGDTTFGIHPQLYKSLRNDANASFVAFLGDITYSGCEAEWDTTCNQLNSISMPQYYVLGNHDAQNINQFYQQTGRKKTYYSFVQENSLFLFLDSESSEQGIGEEQLDWIESELMKSSAVDRVFVLMHKLIWWNQHSIFKEITVNSRWNTDHMKLNFWTDIEPLFNGLGKHVYFIAGDMAGDKNDDGYMYFNYENLHFIGTGVGASEESNYLHLNVHENNAVSIDVHLLNDSINTYDLKTYTVPFLEAKKSPLKPI